MYLKEISGRDIILRGNQSISVEQAGVYLGQIGEDIIEEIKTYLSNPLLNMHGPLVRTQMDLGPRTQQAERWGQGDAALTMALKRGLIITKICSELETLLGIRFNEIDSLIRNRSEDTETGVLSRDHEAIAAKIWQGLAAKSKLVLSEFVKRHSKNVNFAAELSLAITILHTAGFINDHDYDHYYKQDIATTINELKKHATTTHEQELTSIFKKIMDRLFK